MNVALQLVDTPEDITAVFNKSDSPYPNGNQIPLHVTRGNPRTTIVMCTPV